MNGRLVKSILNIEYELSEHHNCRLGVPIVEAEFSEVTDCY